jgi:threonylcarbamoyladenosine tRNA methylthiotransferase MtaB
MKRTFQSFVFGCRVNEAERIRFDNELRKAGFTVDLNNPAYSIINTCAITGKAEREAKQLIYSLRKQFPATKVVITGCSATYWAKRFPEYTRLVDIVIPNSHKTDLASLLLQASPGDQPRSEAIRSAQPIHDKFRQSNRLLVKIQDGCHRFCNYCIVPYLRGNPQSQTIQEIVSYINSFDPTPSEVILSAINTESFGKDTKETMVDLIGQVLDKTSVKRIGFGSIHPWSLTDEFLDYYRTTLSKEPRFVHFFHVPIQSGSQTMLTHMRREYDIADIMQRLMAIKAIRPDAFIATDIIVGYLGETDALFDETHNLLVKSPISRFHVFPFSNRMHTAAYYLKRRMEEPTPTQKKERAEKLRILSDIKYADFKAQQKGTESDALVIAQVKGGVRVVTHNNIELVVKKNALPGDIIHVTIKD